ncbi:MAG: HD domain-containing protein, partial [Patescibacteria group bacterium]
MDVKNLINKSFTSEEEQIIRRAFDFSKKEHQGQKRKSGEVYFTHCYQAALKLAEWQMDATTIAAGLIHDVVEDTKISLEDVKKEFNEEIAFLIDGVTKLGRVKYRQQTENETALQSENIRKMILALSQDLRVI